MTEENEAALARGRLLSRGSLDSGFLNPPIKKAKPSCQHSGDSVPNINKIIALNRQTTFSPLYSKSCSIKRNIEINPN